MKYTNRDLAHHWIHSGEYSGKASNYFFEGDVIYSYGKHFPIARKNVAPDVHFITTDIYSNTTSRHVSYTRQALPGTVIEVPNVLAESEQEHVDNFADIVDRINESLQKAKRARVNYNRHLYDARKLYEQADKYRASLSLPVTMPQSIENGSIDQWIKDKEKKAIQKNNRAIQDWLSCDRLSIPDGVKKVYLRVNGDRVETSKNASFLVSDAKRFFPLVQRCVAGGKSVRPENVTLGMYTVNCIMRNGTVIAGCHTVEYDQILRIVEQLGMVQETAS